MQVKDKLCFGRVDTGARVSNAYAIYPQSGDNISDEVLIPDDAATPHGTVVKVSVIEDEHASH